MSYDIAMGGVLPPSIGYGLDTAGINTAGQFLNYQYGPTLPSIFPSCYGGGNPLASYAMTTGASQSFDIDGDLTRGCSGGFGFGGAGFYGGFGYNNKMQQEIANMTPDQYLAFQEKMTTSQVQSQARLNDMYTDIGINSQVKARQAQALLEAPQQAIMQDVGIIKTQISMGQDFTAAFNKLLADVQKQNPRLDMDQVKAQALTYCGNLPADIMNGDSSLYNSFKRHFLGGVLDNGNKGSEENLAFVQGTSVSPMAAKHRVMGEWLGYAADAALGLVALAAFKGRFFPSKIAEKAGGGGFWSRLLHGDGEKAAEEAVTPPATA